MRITELNISEFGCLKDKKITLADGMNVIYGENESGKSTLLLFIKFMLYGLGRRSASNSERERSVSWSGHTAAGSMSFLHGGKNYRIERRYIDGSRGGNEEVSIICLDSGIQINTDKSAGEYFLGVPKEVFESSACVGQMGATDVNGEKVSSSIQNILTSADETVDTSKILKTLDNIRVAYRYKNKNGGSLYDMERQLSEQKQELERTREATLSLDEQTQKLNIAKRDYEIVKRDFETQDNLLGELNKLSIIKRFDECHKREEQRRLLAEAAEKYRKASLTTEFFPTRQHLAELELSAKRFDEAEEHAKIMADELSGISDGGYDKGAAELGEKIEARGGVRAITEEINGYKNRMDKQSRTVIMSAIAGAVCAVVGIVLALALGFWGALGLVAFAVLPIIMAPICSKKKKELKTLIDDIAAEYETEEELLFEKLEYCVKNLALRRNTVLELAKAEAALKQAELAAQRAHDELLELLKLSAPELEPTSENARIQKAHLEEFLTKFDEIRARDQALANVIDSERAALEHYDEAELRAQVTIDVSELTPNAMAEAERSRKFLLQKKLVFEQKISTLKDYVIGLRANAKDPLPMADAIADLEEKYRVDSEFYSALTLAMESIEKAGEVMSGNVMPMISSHASEIMGRISAEKYTTLRSTGNLALSVDSDGFGVKSDFLSAGTKDAAYLSLRIALFMKIYGEELPPLVLDEALCQLDDTRTERMLGYLSELSDNGIQSLLFTSHKREEQICKQKGFDYNAVILG